MPGQIFMEMFFINVNHKNRSWWCMGCSCAKSVSFSRWRSLSCLPSKSTPSCEFVGSCMLKRADSRRFPYSVRFDLKALEFLIQAFRQPSHLNVWLTFHVWSTLNGLATEIFGMCLASLGLILLVRAAFPSWRHRRTLLLLEWLRTLLMGGKYVAVD